MSDIKKLAGQTAVYGVPTIVGRFLNYFLVPLYTYNIATQDYGMVSELYAYVAFLMILLTYGMETAFFRFSQDNDKDKVFNTAMLSLLCSTSLFLIVTFVCLKPITAAMEYQGHPSYIVLFLLILAVDALKAIPYALLRRENRPKRFALIKTTDIFSNIIFNLFFIALCPVLYRQKHAWITSWFNPNDLVFYIFLSNLIACVIAMVMLLPEYKKFRFDADLQLLKKMLSYGFPVMIGGLAGMVNETFDRIALKHLVNVPEDLTDQAQISQWKMSQIGIYGACYKLSVVISLFIQAFKFAAEPFFFSKMKKDNAKQSYSSVMTAFVIFLCFVFLVVMGYIDIFKYFMGSQYRQGISVVPVLLMANIFLGIYYNLSIWYKVTDKTKWGAVISIIGAVITLAGNYLLVPVLSYTGAAVTTLVCYVSIAVICYCLGQKYYPVDYKVKRCLMYVFLSVALFGVMSAIRTLNAGTPVNIACSTLLIALYAAVAFKFDIRKLLK
ncbi:MAG: oligosaccharide flippase family protein [Bacteroidales bacterium]|nr:oligosaccharide flippase family protein [Bacteroidales bacterium]MBP3254771.1 oligosaccharide flippase family protein [Bacteroidales bacterium]